MALLPSGYDGGICRGLCVYSLHAALGRWYDCRTWLDCRGAGGFWHVENEPDFPRAYLFGMVTLGELAVQSLGFAVPSQFLTAMPFVITIVVLAIISADMSRLRLHAPYSLGETYDGSEPR